MSQMNRVVDFNLRAAAMIGKWLSTEAIRRRGERGWSSCRASGFSRKFVTGFRFTDVNFNAAEN
jgi:hypothetical protein